MESNEITVPAPRRRIRAEGITWGIVVATVASLTLFLVSDAGRREEFWRWLLDLTPGDVTVIAVAAGGAILVVAGLLCTARSMQK